MARRMGMLLILASLLIVLKAQPCDNPPYFVPADPPTWVFYSGNDGRFTVTAQDDDPSDDVTIESTYLPDGVRFDKDVASGDNPVTYNFLWTPKPDSVSMKVCFMAMDSGDLANIDGNYCIPCLLGEGDLIWLTGKIRDFPSSHPDFDIADGDDGVSFVENTLGASGLPVYSGGATTTTNATFSQWWSTMDGVNEEIVYSLTLNNGNQDLDYDKRVYTTDMSHFFPIDKILLGNEGEEHNFFFTYELHGYITYTEGVVLNFRSSDDLWVFVNNRLPSGWDLGGVHDPKSFALDLDMQSTYLGGGVPLENGTTYRLDIFFAHRSNSRDPDIQAQAPKGLLCNAVYSGQTELDASTFAPADDLYFLSGGSYDADRLRIVQPGGVSGAVYYGSSTAPVMVKILSGFRTEFTFSTTGPACEGFAFVIQSSGVWRSTTAAFSLGYHEIPNSLAVEFDMTFSGAEHDPNDPIKGPYQHVSVHWTTDGSPNTADHGVSTFPLSTNDPRLTMNNGTDHRVAIEYLPPREGDAGASGRLQVWMNDNIVPLVTVLLDDMNFLSASAAYVGFTGSATPSLSDGVLIKKWKLITVPPSPFQTSLVSQPANFPAGTTSSAIAQARDDCGNAIYVGGEVSRFTAWLERSFGDPMTLPVSVTDIGFGRYEFSYSSGLAGDVVLWIQFDGTFIANNARHEMRVLPGVVSPPMSSLLKGPKTVRYDNAGGDGLLMTHFSALGDVVTEQVFDFAAGGAAFLAAVQALPSGAIVAVAVRGTLPSWDADATQAIGLLGGRLTDLQSSQSYCMIGEKDLVTTPPALNLYEDCVCGANGTAPCLGLDRQGHEITKLFSFGYVVCESAGSDYGPFRALHGPYARTFSHVNEIVLSTRTLSSFQLISRDEFGNWLADPPTAWQINFQASGPDVGSHVVTTHAPGVTDVTFNTTLAGNYELVVKIDGVLFGSTLSFKVVPGPAYALSCQTQESAEATGLFAAVAGEPAFFYVRLFDFDSNRILGNLSENVVTGTMNGTDAQVIPLTVEWSASEAAYLLGYTTTVANDDPGSTLVYSFSVIVNGIEMDIDAHPTVIAAAEHSLYSEPLFAPLGSTLLAGDAAEFYIQSRDRFGNPRQHVNELYDFFVIGLVGASPVMNITADNIFGGEYKASFDYLLAGDPLDLFLYLGPNITGSPAFTTSLLVLPNVPSEMSYLFAPSLATGVAGQTNFVYFRSVDAYGNVRLNLDDHDSFVAQIRSATDTAATVIDCSLVCPSASGDYEISWQTILTGTYTISVNTIAAFGGNAITDSSVYSVDILPGPTHHASYSGSGTSGGVVAKNAVFYVHAEDIYNNSQVTTDDPFTVTITWPDPRVDEATVTSDGPGRYRVRYLVGSTDWQSFNISVFLDGELLDEFDGLAIPNTALSYARVCSNETIVKYEPPVFSDYFVPADSCTTIDDMPAGEPTTLYVLDLVTAGNYKCGRQALQCDPEHLGSWEATYFTVLFQDVDTGEIQADWLVTVSVQDLFPLWWFEVDLTPNQVGVFNVTLLEYGSIESFSSGLNFSVLPGAPYGPLSRVYGLPVSDYIAGEERLFNVSLHDQYGNLIVTDENRTLYATVFNGEMEQIDQIPLNWTADGSSLYTGSFNITLTGSDYQMWVTIQDPFTTQMLIDNPELVVDQASGYTLVVRAAPAHAPSCYLSSQYPENLAYLVTAPELTSLVAGLEGFVDLSMFDRFGNAQSADAESFSTNWGTGTVNSQQVGVYVHRFRISNTVTGVHALSIELSGVPVQSSPFDITVDPSTLSPSYSTVTFNNAQVVAGQDITFVMQTKDVYDNAWLDDQDLQVTACLGDCWDSPLASFQVPCDVTPVGLNGEYNVVLPGVFTQTVGAYTFQIKVPGGVPFFVTENTTVAVAGPTDPLRTRLPLGFSPGRVDTESPLYFLQSRDQYGNPTVTTNDTFTLLFRRGPTTCASWLGGDEAFDSYGPIVPFTYTQHNVGPGNYSFFFTPFEQGDFTFDLIVNNVSLPCATVAVLTVVVEAGDAAAVYSSVAISETEIYACDTDVPFPQSGCTLLNHNILKVDIVLRDSHTNPLIRPLEGNDGALLVGETFDYFVFSNMVYNASSYIDSGSEVVQNGPWNVLWTNWNAATATRSVYLSTRFAGSYRVDIVHLDASGDKYLLDNQFAEITVLSATPVQFQLFPSSPFDNLVAAYPTVFSIQAQDVYNNNVSESDEYSYNAIFQKTGLGAYSFHVELQEAGFGLHVARILSIWHGVFDVDIQLKNPAYESIKAGSDPTPMQINLQGILIRHATCDYDLPGFPFRCPIDRTCHAAHADCTDYTDGCTSTFECVTSAFPSTTCTDNASSCPCLDPTPIRCPTGVCVAGLIDCLVPADCPSTAPYECMRDGASMGFCRMAPEDCPTPLMCPPGTILCPNQRSCALVDRWDSDCADSVTGCASNLRPCPDGTCVKYWEDCPTPTTCPPGTVYCSDGSCEASVEACPNQYQCHPRTSEDSIHRCPDGSCRASIDQCPTHVSCPAGFVLCPDGQCLPTFAQCLPHSSCPYNQTRCPDGSCRDNMMHCPSQVTCPTVRPVLCADGSCVSTLMLCPKSPTCPAELGLRTCPDGSCVLVGLPCPTTITCPDSAPVLCPDGSCTDSTTNCAVLPPCPVDVPVRCPDGSCRGNLIDCPTRSVCPSDRPLMCPDGRCVLSIDECADVSLIACAPDEIRCPGGGCAFALPLCPTHTTCPIATIKCIDGTCRSSCPPSDYFQSCPPNTVRCPQAGVGLLCTASIDQCPQAMICPSSLPVKCLDATCAATVSDCPPPAQEYPENKIPCPDGVWALDSSNCGTPVTCPPDFPYKCFDQTCRISPQDCPIPTSSSCPEGLYLCPTGACVDRLWASSCTPVQTPCVDGALPVKCPTGECVAAIEDCPPITFEVTADDSTGVFETNEIQWCPEGVPRCRDGSCKADSRRCDSLQCPEHLPYLCSDGLCTDQEAHCNFLNGCPWDKALKCWDGSCESAYVDCPIKDDLCPAGMVDCPDGSCRSDPSACPSASGCVPGERRCHDGTCVSSSSSENLCLVGSIADSTGDLANACPGGRPFRCPSGLCAMSSSACPVIPDNDCPLERPVSCAVGSCVVTSDQCPLLKPCKDGQVRCGNGACAELAHCPRANLCPDTAPYRCADSGVCASALSECPVARTGCPISRPFKCLSGECRVSEAECVWLSSNGCPADRPIKCFHGECVANEVECMEPNGCPPDEPFRCTIDGSCHPSPVCPATRDPTLIYHCADGEWVADPSTCRASNGCPAPEPIRCQDGACAAYPAYADVEGASVCTLTVACHAGEVMCAGGACAAHSSLCAPALPCSGVRCPDLSCAADLAECALSQTEYVCPREAPVLCSSGVCKSVPELCPDVLAPTGETQNPFEETSDTSEGAGDCPPSAPFLCFDGSCHATNVECTDWAELIHCGVDGSLCNDTTSSLGQWCLTGQILCADGQCAEWSKCPAVRACPRGTMRCWDGTCTNTSVCPGPELLCPAGETRCEDGLCRPLCLPYNGCPLQLPYHCLNRECAEDSTLCDAAAIGKPNTGRNLLQEFHRNASDTPVSPTFLLACYTNCRADRKVVSTTYLIDYGENYQFVLARDENLVAIATLYVSHSSTSDPLQVPSGAIISSSGQTTARLEVNAVPDSRMLFAENKIQPTRADFGSFMTLAQTVLSPAFECVVDSNTTVTPFPVPLIIEAGVDLDRNPLSEDICLATIYEVHEGSFHYQTWRCLSTHAERILSPVRDPASTAPPHIVSATLDSCEEEAVYAFIHAPIAIAEDDTSVLDWAEENVVAVMLIVIGVVAVAAAVVYTAARLARYRKKYHLKRDAVAEMQKDVDEMEQFGGKAGKKDDEVVFVMNPLQVQLADMQKQLTLEELEMQEAEAKARRAQSTLRKAHIGTLRADRDRLKKELDRLKLQLEHAHQAPKTEAAQQRRRQEISEIATPLPAEAEPVRAFATEFEQVAPQRRRKSLD